MKLTLDIWRQPSPEAPGAFKTYVVDDAVPEMTLLELLDHLNLKLVEAGEEPVAFESDCREGICGCCGLAVDGRPHGPKPNTTACHQHVRSFSDGDRVKLEPFRSEAFPVVKDLIVDRTGLDRVIQAGGWVSVDAGTAPDADTMQVTHEAAEEALDFSACIGCGACVAACPNSAAYLFVGAKLQHLGVLPQGKMERGKRATAMINQMEHEFGPCSTYQECVDVCPAGIDIKAIAVINKERMRSLFRAKAN